MNFNCAQCAHFVVPKSVAKLDWVKIKVNGVYKCVLCETMVLFYE